MFDFDDLKDDETKATTTASSAEQRPKDLQVGRAYRLRVGEDEADALFGSLLRTHMPEEYASCREEANGKEEADRKAAEEKAAQAKALKEEQERQEKQEREEKERKDKEEKERREKEENERKEKEEKERKDKEEKERREKEEKEKQEKEEKERKDKEDRERREKEEQRREKEEAEKKAKEQEAEAARAAEEEAKRKAAEEQAAADKPEEAAEEPGRKFELLSRAEARKRRWEDISDLDSADEALGTLSGIARSFSAFTSAISVGFSFAMSSDPAVAGRQIANMCRSHGGIYIKAAQTASSMEYAFPREVLDEFESLQDSADPQPWYEVSERVEKHTPGGIASVYEYIGETPINAASIAQVHLGKRLTGETVVVKILRRSLQRTFSHDVGNYLSLLGMYESATGVKVQWMVEWQMEELKKELDFRWEADLQENCYDFVRSKAEIRKHIAVPELHSELCTKRILVMEYIEGCKINKVSENFPDWDRARDLPVLFNAMENWHAMQLFLTGTFHGDPHPGNVLVRRRKDKVLQGECPFECVIIDHGGYYTLEEPIRKLYAEAWSMMDKPRDEKQRLARRARLTEILTGWGVAHISRFVIEQMFTGNFGAADPTANIQENGEARRHRFNWLTQKRDDLGPPVFEETGKMPPALMKAFGVGNFTQSAWRQLSKGMKGWNHQQYRIDIMVKWARQSPGVKRPP